MVALSSDPFRFLSVTGVRVQLPPFAPNYRVILTAQNSAARASRFGAVPCGPYIANERSTAGAADQYGANPATRNRLHPRPHVRRGPITPLPHYAAPSPMTPLPLSRTPPPPSDAHPTVASPH